MPATATPSTGTRIFERFTVNAAGKVRHTKLAGRPVVVVPQVMITEGVHSGDNGPILYEGRDMRGSVPLWNHRPVLVYHPQRGKSGCTPKVLNDQQVGVILNTGYKVNAKGIGRLPSESWLYEDRVAEVDERVLEAINRNEMMELSTGLWALNQNKTGTWKGEEYVGIARRYAPDHLALLPDREGACSLKDGAGFMRLNQAADNPEGRRLLRHLSEGMSERLKLTVNGLSFSDITNRLRDALAAKYGEKGRSWNGWVADVFDTFVVYYNEEAKLHRHEYSMSGNAVKLSGDPVAVRIDTNYVAVSNETSPHVEESKMAKTIGKKKVAKSKEARIAEAITNEKCPWGEDDRTWLMGLDDARLTTVLALQNAADDEDEDDDDEEEAPITNKKKTPPVKRTPVANEADDDDDDEEDAPAKQPTFNELLETADPATRAVIKTGLREYKRKVKGLVAKLTANKACKFTKEELQEMDVDVLEKMAAMVPTRNARDDDDDDDDLEDLPRRFRPALYAGAGGLVENEADDDEDMPEPLGLPHHNERGEYMGYETPADEDEEEEKPRKKRQHA